jgi:hypothetical protein
MERADGTKHQKRRLNTIMNHILRLAYYRKLNVISSKIYESRCHTVTEEATNPTGDLHHCADTGSLVGETRSED